MNSMKKQTLCVLAAMICAAQQANANHPDSVYIATYANNPKAGLHVAYSSDNSRWIGIGDNYDFVKSDFGAWGSQKQMFAPSVLKHDGVWYAVWGVNTDKRQFATTKSSDLWLWKPQDYPYMDVPEVLEPVLSREGDEFVVILSGHDYEYRTKLMELLHTQSLENIGKGDVVVSGGCSDYIPGEDRELHAVFERADALMYAEKKELKALGAKTR